MPCSRACSEAGADTAMTLGGTTRAARSSGSRSGTRATSWRCSTGSTPTTAASAIARPWLRQRAWRAAADHRRTEARRLSRRPATPTSATRSARPSAATAALSSVRTDDLAAVPIKALMARNKEVDWAAVADVIYGCANQAGEDNRNVARMAALLAGLPIEVPGATINRLCGSGMDAVGHRRARDPARAKRS